MPTIAQMIEARGMAEGMAEGLLLLLGQKFGSVPEARQQQIAGAGQDEFDAWLGRLLAADNVDEVFGNAN